MEHAPSKRVCNAILSRHVDAAKDMKKESVYRYARLEKEKHKLPIPLPRHKKHDSTHTVGEELREMGSLPYQFGEEERKLTFKYLEPEDKSKPGGRVILIMDEENTAKLAPKAKTVFGDATFDAVIGVHDCYQVFTMMVKDKGKFKPLWWALMEDKKEGTYARMFEGAKEEVPDLQPKKLKSDFEKGLRNAFKRAFPDATVEGCGFHHNQATWKNAVKRGIADPCGNKKK
ncbi:hypothetical protein QAD02_002918 [Eretmocerus hayati]|uniref:Uncharacterized protein n=1 Tax=Eretmocerus hayati TaxID=131215 RepID=A0ACC2NMW8_9HYME|nr:hypothetical protein QAD02_002918 [Eretmocerus hayati]